MRDVVVKGRVLLWYTALSTRCGGREGCRVAMADLAVEVAKGRRAAMRWRGCSV
jgi:hypothetical protein